MDRYLSAVVAVAELVLVSACPASAKTFNVIYSFCAEQDCADGASPAGIIRDTSGNIFGTTSVGGTYGQGTIFELSKDGSGQWHEKVLYSFCAQPGCADGGTPQGKLIVDGGGSLYGTTAAGGAGGGVAFELKPNHGSTRWKYELLHVFCELNGCSDGSYPSALTYAGANSGLAFDGVSPLYATARNGGAHGAGVVFELKRKRRAWQETILYDFCALDNCHDGANPYAALLVDSSGNLYGTTYQGGSGAGGPETGTVFRLTPSEGGRWTNTVLWNFCDVYPDFCDEGWHPETALTMDSSGALLGVTRYGGEQTNQTNGNNCQLTFRCGVVYRLKLVGAQWTYTNLHTFCAVSGCDDGDWPDAPLTLDSEGNMFGVSVRGGHETFDEFGFGVVYGWRNGNFVTVRIFCHKQDRLDKQDCLDGANPTDLLMTSSNDFFGTTANGGVFGKGTVFELTP